MTEKEKTELKMELYKELYDLHREKSIILKSYSKPHENLRLLIPLSDGQLKPVYAKDIGNGGGFVQRAAHEVMDKWMIAIDTKVIELEDKITEIEREIVTE